MALARFYTDVALEWASEDERFQHLDWRVEWRYPGSFLQRYEEQSRRYHERKRIRPIQPDVPLRECLERLTRGSLVAMARVHDVDYVNVCKEQLIQRMAGALTDPYTLKQAVSGLSGAEFCQLGQGLPAPTRCSERASKFARVGPNLVAPHDSVEGS
ncbi:MAG: hypothetical protein RML46_03710 [Anaerolineae bacterium]|nr:hypothetical protein [Anaerolineae bacterium]MDW8067998.1 hypothetical protein [Anaerolineae bacterium]